HPTLFRSAYPLGGGSNPSIRKPPSLYSRDLIPRESLHESASSVHGPVTVAGRHGARFGPGSPRAVIAGRAAAVLCADRAAGAARGRQRVRDQGGAESQ